MDGRIQLPVIHYLQERFDAAHVDTISEAGPNRILADRKNTASIRSILERLRISIENHKSTKVAVVGHYDCAGNPAPKEDQIDHLQKAVDFISGQHQNIEIIGLWVDENWEVHEVI